MKKIRKKIGLALLLGSSAMAVKVKPAELERYTSGKVVPPYGVAHSATSGGRFIARMPISADFDFRQFISDDSNFRYRRDDSNTEISGLLEKLNAIYADEGPVEDGSHAVLDTVDANIARNNAIIEMSMAYLNKLRQKHERGSASGADSYDMAALDRGIQNQEIDDCFSILHSPTKNKWIEITPHQIYRATLHTSDSGPGFAYVTTFFPNRSGMPEGPRYMSRRVPGTFIFDYTRVNLSSDGQSVMAYGVGSSEKNFLDRLISFWKRQRYLDPRQYCYVVMPKFLATQKDPLVIFGPLAREPLFIANIAKFLAKPWLTY